MPDIRSRKKIISVENVNPHFQILQPTKLSGFGVKISFDYNLNNSPKVVGFRIYKAVLPQSRLKKEYVITQKALEKLTSIKSSTKNNTLFDKSLISQNSKVKFAESNSNKHDKIEGDLSTYVFSNISFIRSEFHRTQPEKNIKNYSWTDRNVKFGESYGYYITVLTSDLFESKPFPFYVNIENFEHPKEPSSFTITETDAGLLLIFGNNQDSTVAKFKVYRRENSEKDFKLLTEIENNNEMIYFSDYDIFPKKQYIYRIFSEDFLGNISLSSIERTGIFRFINPTRNLEYQPSIYIDADVNKKIRIRARNENNNKVKSLRIERRDDWNFEQGFSLKTYQDYPWENNLLFDEKNLIEFIDRSVEPSRVYSYKITAFSITGHPVSYFVTPPLKPGEIYGINNIQTPKNVRPRIRNFSADVVNEKQDPVYVKASWQIDGDWLYLVIDTGNKKIKIDNYHTSAYLSDFKKGNKYKLSMEVYDLLDRKVDEYKGVTINL